MLEEMIDETLEDLEKKASVRMAIQLAAARMAESELRGVAERKAALKQESQRWTGAIFD